MKPVRGYPRRVRWLKDPRRVPWLKEMNRSTFTPSTTNLFGPDGGSRTSSRRWRTTRPKRTSTNCSAASKKVTTAGSRQVKRLRERPFFLASDGDGAVTYG